MHRHPLYLEPSLFPTSYLTVSEKTVFPFLPEVDEMTIATEKQVTGNQHSYVHIYW